MEENKQEVNAMADMQHKMDTLLEMVNGLMQMVGQTAQMIQAQQEAMMPQQEEQPQTAGIAQV